MRRQISMEAQLHKTDLRAKESEQGFSLLETAIAMVVMMVMALAVASLFAFAVNYNSGANDRTVALALAQQRLERLRDAAYWDSVMTAGSTTETIQNGAQQYTVVTTVCDSAGCGGSDSLKLITIQVRPSNLNQWVNSPVIVVSQRANPASGPYQAQ